MYTLHCDRWQCLIKFPFSYRCDDYDTIDPRRNVVVRAKQHKLVETYACVNSRLCGRNNTSNLGIMVGVMDWAITSHLDPRSGTGYYFSVWCWVWIAVAGVAGDSSLPSRLSHQLPSVPSSNDWRRTGGIKPSFELRSIIIVNILFFFFLWCHGKESLWIFCFARYTHTMILLVIKKNVTTSDSLTHPISFFESKNISKL